MAFYDWTPALSVGIDSIDRQHRTLIGYINTLADAIEKGNASQIIGTTLSNLVAFTKMHFMYEEMLFDKFGYPASFEHKGYHARLVNRVLEYQARYKNGDSNFGNELLEFLKDWLNHHILSEDMGYSPFLKLKGVN